MKVAQIVDRISLGGAERLVATFTTEAQKQGIHVTVIGLKLVSEEFADELRNSGADVVVFEGRGLSDLGRFKKLYDYLSREHFDIIHTHLTYSNILGTSMGRLAGIPVVSSFHSTPVSKKLRSRIERAVVRNGSNGVVAVGYAVADAHRFWVGDEKLKVIQNGISPLPSLSPQQRLQVRRDIAGDPNRPILIAVGRYATLKAFPVLIDVFRQVHDKHPDAFLTIVGDGGEFAKVQARVEQHGLQDDVNLTGWRHDVPELLAASDMYVSSSLVEGLSVALLEAMSVGLPPVITNVGDAEHVVKEGTGIFVPPNDNDALADAICHLLDDRDNMRAMGAAAQQHVIEQFSVENWFQKLKAFYDQIIERTG
jgi:glycosyltransferase involved in cell wall biosynthesis